MSFFWKTSAHLTTSQGCSLKKQTKKKLYNCVHFFQQCVCVSVLCRVMISVCTCSSTQHPDLRRLRTMRFCSERYDTNRCSTVPFSAQLFCYFVLVLLLNYQAGLAHPPIILGRGDSHPEEQVQPTNYLMRR